MRFKVGDFLAYHGDEWGPNHTLSQVISAGPFGDTTVVMLLDWRGVRQPRRMVYRLPAIPRTYHITEDEALRRLLAV